MLNKKHANYGDNMIKDTTTITTYKFTNIAPKPQTSKKVLNIKFPIEFKPTKDTKKMLNVKQYRVTGVLDKVN